MSKFHTFNKGKGTKLSDGKIHSEAHQTWSRRSFLQALGLSGGASMMLGSFPLYASSPTPLGKALSQLENDRILVLIRLKGGNDGLNTIIPIDQYDVYANNRQTIKIAETDILNLSDEYGIPTFMDSLDPMWIDGKMKVVHGVGYPDQNLSHFRSSDIWASASDSDQAVNSGWFGRHFDDEFPDFILSPPDAPPAIQIGSIGNLIFDGIDGTGYSFSVSNPEQLYQIAQNGWLHDVENLPDCYYGEQVGFLRSIANTTFLYANVINEAFGNSTNAVEYDDSELGNQLSIVARLIKGGLDTKVYLVTLNGFDTHANQPELHQAIMTDMADSVALFYEDLEAGSVDDKVLSMTFSEFGRRVEQNASNGTDHGSSAPLMLFGPALNGNGFVGEHPSLSDLDSAGNMAFTTDFRQVYASILENWLCIESDTVDELLLDVYYDRLPLGLDCMGVTVDEYAMEDFKHRALYDTNGEIYIQYFLPRPMSVNIKIYNLMGQYVTTLVNERQLGGENRVAIKAQAENYSVGQYIYRIVANGKAYSKSFIISR
jgi:uncharacterized protein (DUF1501 family)